MEINETYEYILEELQKGHRPRVSLENEDIDLVIKELENRHNIQKNLCIICHLRTPTPSLHAALLTLLDLPQEQLQELTPFIMESFTRHFIEYQHQFGEAVPAIFLKKLAEFTKACPKEQLIYPLSVIESLGGRSIYFKSIIGQIDWGLRSIFSRQQREAIEIIKRIEKFWPN